MANCKIKCVFNLAVGHTQYWLFSIILNWFLWRFSASLFIYLHLTQIGRNTRHANSLLMLSSSNTTITNSRMVKEERSRRGLTTESGDQRREVTISQILVIIVIVFLVTQSFKVGSSIIVIKCIPIGTPSGNY